MRTPPTFRRSLLAGLFWLVIAVICQQALAQEMSEADFVRRALVRVRSTAQYPDYREPWKPGFVGGGVGTGFIIAGNLIMTNAHVVSNSRFLLVARDGDTTPYPAAIKFIAHDCDLALLEVADARFFRGSAALEFNGLPEINSNVAAYGFPIGGDRLSVTRGIVSRIEFRQYVHSGMDSHLCIQVDAAINPGNSGGPVILDRKVVGVAFQSYSGNVAQNTGYMIPTPVIQRFLEDVKDGHYDGYTELALRYQNLLNPSYRRALGLPPDNLGVLVTDVMKGGSSQGGLQAGDILLKIDGYAISASGTIPLGKESVQLEEIVERKHHGEKVKFDLLRDGKPMVAGITLKGAWPYAMFSLQYDTKPRFVVFAGMVFQPLSRNLMRAINSKDLDLNYIFQFYVEDDLYLERPEVIVLSNILPDSINRDLSRLENKVVDEVNGVRITTLKELAEALAKPVERHVIKLHREGRPIIIDASAVAAANERIRAQYQVTSEQYLE